MRERKPNPALSDKNKSQSVTEQIIDLDYLSIGYTGTGKNLYALHIISPIKNYQINEFTKAQRCWNTLCCLRNIRLEIND